MPIPPVKGRDQLPTACQPSRRSLRVVTANPNGIAHHAQYVNVLLSEALPHRARCHCQQGLDHRRVNGRSLSVR
jgi:hypothetical protein